MFLFFIIILLLFLDISSII